MISYLEGHKYLKSVISKLLSEYKIDSRSSSMFRYIGLEIKQDKKDIILNQANYLNGVHCISVNAKRAASKYDDINEEEMSKLKSLVGQLGWLSNNTRPDISYDVLEISCSFKRPIVDDLLKVNKCVKKLKANNLNLIFSNLGDLTKIKLCTFSDASHANLPDGYSSAGGYIVFLVGENGTCAPPCLGV